MSLTHYSSDGPLAAHPLIRTKSVAELEEVVEPLYGKIKIDLTRRNRSVDAVSNHVQIGNVGVTYGRHGAGITLTLPQFDSYAQLFSFRGAANVKVGRAEVDVAEGSAFIASPDQALQLSYAPDFEQLILKIEPLALQAKLQALIGDSLGHHVSFKPAASTKRKASQKLHRRILELIAQIDTNAVHLNASENAALEDELIVSFLIANSHSYSHLLERDVRLTGQRQLRLAEGYIEANWDRPLSIELLAATTGASARSVFQLFQRERGYSPMKFLQRVRLDHARAMLRAPNAATSVTGVALACGFGNLGHFAGYYLTQFGESPSVTLRRSKRDNQGQ